MTLPSTEETIDRFNHAFIAHDPSVLPALVAENCVMEAIEPAPDGARLVGRRACLDFWQALVNDTTTQFAPERVSVAGEEATIMWRYRFGEGDREYVRGVNLMRVRDGKIVEALGYSKTPSSDQTGLAELLERPT
jgi:ketosteroid isomerase-like protein